MKLIVIGIVSLAVASPAVAQNRRTIYVDRMEGLEASVEKALQDAELPFEFIEEEKQPELKANLTKMHSAQAEILYKHKLGRNETHRLELRDVASNKVIVSHQFALNRTDEQSQREAAADFASKVQKAWAKRKPNSP